MNYRLISYNNIFYIINKIDTESQFEFLSRCDYISKKNPKTQIEFDNLIILSQINNNINFYKVSYPSHITDLV